MLGYNVYSLSDGMTFMGKPISASPFERQTIVPGGEIHFKLRNNLHNLKPNLIVARLNSAEDIITLYLAGKTLQENNIHFDLFVPYIPGGRQDRVEIKGEPFSLKFYAELINSIPFDKLKTFSPHSIVTTALLRSVEVLSYPEHLYSVLQSTIDQDDDAWIIAPDEGSSKRTFNIFKLLKSEFPLLRFAQCLKNRNPETGVITGIKCLESDLMNYPCFIFDDICDGGRTFNLLAKDLKEKNCGDLYLKVDHGIFSYGLAELFSNFKKIWSTNSIKYEIKDEKFEVIIQYL